MSIRIEIPGLDDMISDLREMTSPANERRAKEALDASLRAAEEVSRTKAHTHRGNLRASIASESTSTPGRWEGSISADSRASHWELERGGEHAAFVDEVDDATSAAFEAAMDSYFSPLKKRR